MDDYVDLGNAAAFSPSNTITVQAWVKPHTYEDNKHVVSKGIDTNFYVRSYSIQGPWANKKWRASLHVGDTEYNITSTNDAIIDQWSHVAMTYDGSTINMYVNGELEAYQSATGSINITGEPLWFGAHADNSLYCFDGKIDDVVLWNIALSQSDIQSSMYSELNGNEPDLAGFWNFNEGTGSTLTDQTANGNDGTIYGATYSTNVPTLLGCTDPSACNYDETANVDDGSCWNAEDGCTCENGQGSAVDECGICDGDGPEENYDCDGNCIESTCLNCAGEIIGCEIECSEVGYDLGYDCAGVCNGGNELDNCGVCDADTDNDCIVLCPDNDLDCISADGSWIDGECWGGNAYVDSCGLVCDDNPDNDCPTPNAGTDSTYTVTHDGNPYTNTVIANLNGCASTGPGELSYAWTPSEDRNPNCEINVLLNPDIFTYILTVSNEFGSAYDEVTITVDEEPNIAPTYNLAVEYSAIAVHTGDPSNDMAVVTLSPSNVEDAENDPLSYQWNQVSGNLISLEGALTDTLAFSAPPGDYSFSLIVIDSYGAGSDAPKTINVTVHPAWNEVPVADAGEDQQVEIEHDGYPETDSVYVTLSCSATDEDSDPLTYAWEGIDDCDGAECTVSLTEGSYPYTCTATDTYDSSNTDDVLITVSSEPNEFPIAHAGSDTTYQLPHDGLPGGELAFALDSSQSFDADGDVVTFTWYEGENLIDSPASVVKPEGDYTFSLTATDSYGKDSTDTVIISVLEEVNASPVAYTDSLFVEIPHDGILATNCITIDNICVSCIDSDNDTYVINWIDLDYQGQCLIETLCVDNTLSSEQTFEYDCVDSYGDIGSGSITVFTNEPNASPVADAGNNQAHQLIHDGENGGEYTFTLNASGSIDVDTDIITFEWYLDETLQDWDPLQTMEGTGETIQVSKVEGSYLYLLRVTDTYGAVSEDHVSISILQEDNAAPVAQAGSDTTYQLPHDQIPGGELTFSLDSSLSFDADGDVVTLAWYEGENLINAPNSVVKPEGDYTFSLTATDSYGKDSTDTVIISVLKEDNEPPIAQTCTDYQEATIPHDGEAGGTVNVNFMASCSTDEDALDVLTYTWFDASNVQVGTTANINIDLEEGIYTYTVKVTDPYDSTSTDEASVWIHPEPNNAPVADAGLDQSITLIHDGDPATDFDNVTICGTASSDFDGDLLSYSWSNGSSVVCPTISVSIGETCFELTVTDPYDYSSTDEVCIYLSEPNEAPVADAGDDQEVEVEHDGAPGGSTDVTLSCTATDADSDSFNYAWDVEGCDGAECNVSLEAGSHTITCTATDIYSAYSSDTVLITVLPEPNGAPTAIPQAEVIEVNLPHDGIPGFGEITLSLDGSGSTDPESDELACTWEPLSSRSDECVVNLSFSEGTYFYQLIVTDTYNSTDTADVEIIVNPELNTIPTVTVECGEVDAFHGNNSQGSPETDLGTVSCVATASDDDGDALIYNWIQILGNQVDTLTISEDGSEISFTSIAGEYTFQANVTDPYSASASASDTAIINVATNEAPVAEAGEDQELEVPHDGDPLTDTVDVTVSCTATDLENDPLTYSWDIEDCDGAECTIPLAASDEPYIFTCHATDTYAVSNTDDVLITVLPEPNEVPIAHAGSDTTYTVFHDSDPLTDTVDVTVSCTATDLENDPLTYSWDIEDCDGAECIIPLAAGNDTLICTVTDTYGASVSDTVLITVLPEPNEVPIAHAGSDTTYTVFHDSDSLTITVDVTLTCTATDEDSDPLTYAWDIEDCDVAECTIPLTASVDPYDFICTATDIYTAASTDTVQITVLPEPNAVPVVDAGTYDTVVEHTCAADYDGCVDLSGTVSDADDGDTISCQWIYDGDVLCDSTACEACFENSDISSASYAITLECTDGYTTVTSDGSVVVDPLVNEPPLASCEDFQFSLGYDAVAGGCEIFSISSDNLSNDPEGCGLEYRWEADNGWIDTGAEVTGEFCEGSYAVELTVADPYGASSESCDFTVTVNEPNNSPVADAGQDTTVTITHDGIPGGTAEVCLDGSDSSDPEGSALEYHWTQIACDGIGYNSVELDDAYSINTCLTSEEGSYCFNLRVTDVFGLYTNDQVVKTILEEENEAPVADAGLNQQIELIHDGDPETDSTVVDICGTATDTDGDILSYSWSNESSEECQTISFSIGDSTCLDLTVSDTYGASDTDTVCVTVIENNNPPVADFEFDEDELIIEHNGWPSEGATTVTLNACDLSNDGDSPPDVVVYQWFNGEEEVGENTCVYLSEELQAGCHTFGLTLTDVYGAIDSAYHDICVYEFNNAPIVDSGDDQYHYLPVDCDVNGETSVTLDGNATIDPESDIIQSWSWIDDLTSVEVSTESSFIITLNEGTYAYSLTVTDIYGASASDSLVVTVIEPNEAPTVVVTESNIDVNEGEEICLEGNASSDEYECTLLYSWEKNDEAFSASADTCFDVRDISINHDEIDVYTLTVTDPYGLSDSTDVLVTIHNINQDPVLDIGENREFQVEHDQDPLTTQYTFTPDFTVSDFDNDSLSFSWLINGVEVSTDSVPTLILDPGMMEIVCNVHDGFDGYASDDISVVVWPEENSWPVAEAGENINIFIENNTYTLDGSYVDVDDPDDIICHWENVDQISYGENVNNIVITDNNDCNGIIDAPVLSFNSYVIMVAELEVVDPYNIVDHDQTTVVIVNENSAPEEVADNGGNREDDIVIYPIDDCNSNTFFTDPHVVDVTYTDDDQDNLLFEWSLDSDLIFSDYVYYTPSGMISTLDHVFSSAGNYVLELNVTDQVPEGEYYDDPQTVSKTWNIHVMSEGDDNIPPEVASNTVDNTEIEHDGDPETSDVTLNLGVDVSDENGHELEIQWLLDGSVISDWSENNNEYEYQVSGEDVYNFAVNVCDCHTCTYLDIPVTVGPEPNKVPVADAGGDQEVAVFHDGHPETDTEDVTLTCSATDEDSDPLTYAWDVAECAGAGAECTIPLIASDDPYIFTCTATDTYGESDSESVEITVTPELNEPPIPNSTGVSYVVCDWEIDLLGEESSDPEYDFITCEWTQTSGFAVNLVNTSNCNATFTAPCYDETTMNEDELYNNFALGFELNVTDSYDVTSTISVPIEGAFTSDLYVDIEHGWTWLSLNKIASNMEINTLLSSMNSTDGDLIKNQTHSAQYYEGVGWKGGLTELAVEGMYMLQSTNFDSLMYTGTVLDTYTISLGYSGWNWIGYTPLNCAPINMALDSLNATEFDVIKSPIASAIYYGPDIGWSGGLQVMAPTEGYKLKVANASTLTYGRINSDVCDSEGLTRKALPATISNWQVDHHDYQFNGIINFSIDDHEDFDGDYISVFVENECRGVAERMYFPYDGSYYYSTMVYSNIFEGEELSFKYYNSLNDEIIDYNEKLDFTADMVVGNGLNTFGLDNYAEENPFPAEYSISRAYPNPFNPVTNFSYTLPQESIVNIAVYDISGRMVLELVNGFKTAGIHQLVLKADDLSSSVYLITMQAGDPGTGIGYSYIHTQKIMLIK